MTGRRLAVAGVLALFALAAFSFARHRCVGTWLSTGVVVPVCPSGELHVIAVEQGSGLRRGTPGIVRVSAAIAYVVGDATQVSRAPIEVKDATLTLVANGKTVALPQSPKNGDQEAGSTPVSHAGFVTLPADTPDGDYTLKAEVHTRAGDAVVEAPLAIYAPAKIHVVTDRPLYEPGNTIKFRAVVLRARDLVPLDGRPGRFVVVDSTGTTVLEEKADAGELGIADAELPLDKTSPAGIWHVRYDSGGASDDVTVEVKPFTLPRFTVDASPARPFYRAKDEPRVHVHVAYASGVPTQAALDVTWSVEGNWPAPAEWVAAFPKSARTDRGGNAELVLPKVPVDLQGKASLTATVEAHDDTGDTQVGQVSVPLAQDAIDVALITELGNHTQLVGGVNNRAYVRATTAAGMPLGNTTLIVKRAWDKKDKGVTVETDEDGVASLQLDPGPPVNIVIPPMPVRLPPPRPVVERESLTEVVRGQATLAEIAAFDRQNAAVGRCARFAPSASTVEVSLQVAPSGAVTHTSGGGDAAACIGAALGGSWLPAGGPRIFQATWALSPELASISTSDTGAGDLPPPVRATLAHALLDARDCLGRYTSSVSLPRALVWAVVNGRYSGTLERVRDDGDGAVLDAGRAACVEGKLGGALRARTLPGAAKVEDAEDEEQSGASFGVVRLVVDPVSIPGAALRAEATTIIGYELAVTARAGEELIGDTKLRVTPGAVPPIRLRASKVIADPGEEITVEILRGPDFQGELPKKLTLSGTEGSIESDVDPKAHAAKFKLPADKDGWYEARFDAGLARIFVPRREALLVDVAPDKRTYRPGEHAKLAITTKEQDKGVKAAVGLFGVDATLAQLAKLTGPDAMDRLASTVTMEHKAFDVIDATALALGRVRGKNAAAATVLLVTAVPSPVDLDTSLDTGGATAFDPVAPLADRFYTVLDALYGEVRHFEGTASKDDKLTPQKMLELWDRALDAAGKKGGPVTDAFGRKLKLPLLPDELIAQTDPRLVVADGTRLPEDIEAWIPFVKRSAR